MRKKCQIATDFDEHFIPAFPTGGHKGLHSTPHLSRPYGKLDGASLDGGSFLAWEVRLSTTLHHSLVLLVVSPAVPVQHRSGERRVDPAGQHRVGADAVTGELDRE